MNPDARAAFARLADVLLPPCDGLPAPSEIDVAGRWIDRVLRTRPDLRPELERVVELAAAEAPERAIDRLQASDPAGLRTLLVAATGAYTMSPKVRRALGYPGQRPRPAYPDEADWDLREGLLDPVVERGPIYRHVP